MNNEERELTVGMTSKEVSLCQEYVVDKNGCQAAIRAGYSENSARQIASENLAKPNIKNYVDYLLRKLSERTMVSAERVVKEYARIAFMNMGDVLDDNGKMENLNKWSRDDLAAVSEITEDIVNDSDDDSAPVLKRKVKMINKLGALDALSKHLGIVTHKVEISGQLDVTNMSDEDLMKELDDE